MPAAGDDGVRRGNGAKGGLWPNAAAARWYDAGSSRRWGSGPRRPDTRANGWKRRAQPLTVLQRNRRESAGRAPRPAPEPHASPYRRPQPSPASPPSEPVGRYGCRRGIAQLTTRSESGRARIRAPWRAHIRPAKPTQREPKLVVEVIGVPSGMRGNVWP